MKRAAAAIGLVMLCLAAGCREATKPAPPPPAQQQAASDSPPEDSAPAGPRNAKLPSELPRDPQPKQSDFPNAWLTEWKDWSANGFAYSDGSDGGCYQLIESVGGGVLSCDIDGDDQIDLCFPGGGDLRKTEDGIQISGRPSGLFRTVALGQPLTDVAALAGFGQSPMMTHGGTVSDFDSDGFDDIVICGYGGVQVWLNQGDGTFEERSAELGIATDAWAVSAAAADYDLDGNTDLYLLTYSDWHPDINRHCLNDQQLKDICGPTQFTGSADRMFRCRPETADFEDVSDKVGLVATNRGLGIVAADFDNNQRPDFAAVNDVEENQLYLNTGPAFEESGLVWGMAFSDTGEREGSMGVDVGDFDNDGKPDLWYTNYAQQDNSLLRNSNDSGFVPSAGITSLSGVSRPWVGFGTGFADFNCDRRPDLFVINGHVAYERIDSPYFQPAQMFANIEGTSFKDVTDQAGTYFGRRRSGRGAGMVDLNNDGGIDLVVSHQNDPASVLLNTRQHKHWVRIRLVGITADRQAATTTIQLTDSVGTQTRWALNGGSYLSHSDRRLLFGISGPDATAKVIWPGGQEEAFALKEIDQTITLIQGRSLK